MPFQFRESHANPLAFLLGPAEVRYEVSVKMGRFRCKYCGKWIAPGAFESGQAIHDMVTPDSDFSFETWESYHLRCDRQSRSKSK